MARLRPWRCYRRLRRPYTRISRSKKKNYIPGAPPAKLRYMVMGNLQKDQWRYAVHLVCKDSLQIRDAALEAVRIMVNKYLEQALGLKNYKLLIRAYPHHVVRENPLAYGAGADRIQKGMRLAFGKPKERAAQVYAGKKLITVYIDSLDKIEDVKYALKVAASKLPGSYTIEAEEVGKGRIYV